jgi:sec-independent protein translocase protein TatA
MPSLGGPEIIVILLVALIVFGPTRLPEISRQVGGALRELRKVQSSVKQELSDAFNANDAPSPSNPGMASAEGDLGEPGVPPPNQFEPPSHGSFN